MTLHVRLLTAVGLALLAAGAVLGLIPATSTDGRCGSPFAPVSAVARPGGCDDPLAIQRTAALGLALVGGGLWAAAFGLHVTDPDTDKAPEPAAGPSTGPAGGSGQAKAGR